MTRLWLDFETYSEAKLPRCGLYRYAEHRSTRILLLAWALDDAPAEVLEPREAWPATLEDALSDPAVGKWAHNANFERAILSARGRACPPEFWRCTMAWARTLGLAGGLGALAAELRLEAGKLDEDKRLVRKFCTPPLLDDLVRDPDWPAFIDYCRRDVEVTRAVAAKLARFPVPADEWRLWAIDQRVNDRGLPVDLDLVRRAIALADRHRDAVTAEATATTGVENPGSREQLLGWLREQGVRASDLRAETVDTLLGGELSDEVRQTLEHRKQLAGTSVAKYGALAETTCRDRRLRGAFQYHRAFTGRFSGRHFQPHNLPRGSLSDLTDLAAARSAVLGGDLGWLATLYDDVTGALSSLVRTAIVAPPGKKLVVADYVGIESVMLAWACRSRYLLQLFRDGRDPYKDFASRLFRVAYDDVTKPQRALAKPATLGCGYGLGAGGLARYAASFGLALTEDQARAQVGLYREAYPDVPRFWAEVEAAVFRAVRTRGEATTGRFTFRFATPFLFAELPSGRALAYYKPVIKELRTPWDELKPTLTYLRDGGHRVSTHPGKLVENLVQAIARDVLAHGLVEAERVEGLEVVGHVHDEVLTLAAIDDNEALPRLEQAMAGTAPTWCPDAPIRADGWEGPWYRKA